MGSFPSHPNGVTHRRRLVQSNDYIVTIDGIAVVELAKLPSVSNQCARRLDQSRGWTVLLPYYKRRFRREEFFDAFFIGVVEAVSLVVFLRYRQLFLMQGVY
jgi:hypothetical protein